MQDAYLIVFCGCPNEDIAAQLANSIIEKNLAACVNVTPPMYSIYRWKNTIENAKEILLMIKTTKTLYPRLEEFLITAHPYECPEIVAISIAQGAKEYLQWIDDTLAVN